MQVLRDRETAETQQSPPAGAAVEVAEWRRSLWGYVARLPDGQRQALVLRFSEHLQYDEVAEALEIPLGTVKSRLFHALASLRQMMADDQFANKLPDFPQEDMPRAM
jgi:RNA polymerase sigma-70 factor (ECF subfamily)